MVRRDINWGCFLLLPIKSNTYNFQIHTIHGIQGQNTLRGVYVFLYFIKKIKK
jgi:hypothetical protein